MLQLLPRLSQYKILLPAGTLDGITVGAMFVGLLESPEVYLPLVGIGAVGTAGITAFTITNKVAGSPTHPFKLGVTMIFPDVSFG